MTDSTNDKPEPSRLSKWFSNPWVGFSGTLASILGFGLAIIFYVASLKSPDLVFSIHPNRTIILRQSEMQDLKVLHRDKPITGDISAVQFQIWNAGKEPIPKSSIRVPLRVTTSKECPILDTRIIKKSRDVVSFELDTKNADKGELSLTWDILEKGDGCIVQVMYLGSSDTTVTASATTIGQPTLHIADTRKTKPIKISLLLLIGSIILLSMLVTYLTELKFQKSTNSSKHYNVMKAQQLIRLTNAIITALIITAALILDGCSVTPPLNFSNLSPSVNLW